MATIAVSNKRRFRRAGMSAALIVGLVAAAVSIAHAKQSTKRRGVEIISASTAEIYLSYDPFMSSLLEARPYASDKAETRVMKALSVNRPPIRIPIRPALRSPFAP